MGEALPAREFGASLRDRLLIRDSTNMEPLPWRGAVCASKAEEYQESFGSFCQGMLGLIDFFCQLVGFPY